MPHIRNMVRIRPFLNTEKAEPYLNVLKREITVPISYRDQRFQFRNVFNMDTDQESLFETVAQPLIDAVIRGYKGSIVTYGATNTGKSYTMFGGQDQFNKKIFGNTSIPKQKIYNETFSKQAGLVPRTLEYYLFCLKNGMIHGIAVCAFLVHDDFIFDLLVYQNDKMIISQEQKSKSFYQKIRNLNRRIITSKEDIYKTLNCIFETKLLLEDMFDMEKDANSLVLKIDVFVEKDNIVEIGKMMLVDMMASSCNCQNTQNQQPSPIMHLQNVCQMLSEGRVNISYKDSTLTKVLKESLDGTYYSTFLGTVSPQLGAKQETLNTLKFISKLGISFESDNAGVGEQINKDKFLSLLNANVLNIKQELDRYRSDAFYISDESFQEIANKKKEHEMLLAQVHEEMEKLIDEDLKCGDGDIDDGKLLLNVDKQIQQVEEEKQILKEKLQTEFKTESEYRQEIGQIANRVKEFENYFNLCEEMKTYPIEETKQAELQHLKLINMVKDYKASNRKKIESDIEKIQESELLLKRRHRNQIGVQKNNYKDNLKLAEKCFKKSKLLIQKTESQNQQTLINCTENLAKSFQKVQTLANIDDDGIISKDNLLVTEILKQMGIIFQDQSLFNISESCQKTYLKHLAKFAETIKPRAVHYFEQEEKVLADETEKLLRLMHTEFSSEAQNFQKIALCTTDSSELDLQNPKCIGNIFEDSYKESFKLVEKHVSRMENQLKLARNEALFNFDEKFRVNFREITDNFISQCSVNSKMSNKFTENTVSAAKDTACLFEKKSDHFCAILGNSDQEQKAEIQIISDIMKKKSDIFKNNVNDYVATFVNLFENTEVPVPSGCTPQKSNGVVAMTIPEVPQIASFNLQDISISELDESGISELEETVNDG